MVLCFTLALLIGLENFQPIWWSKQVPQTFWGWVTTLCWSSVHFGGDRQPDLNRQIAGSLSLQFGDLSILDWELPIFRGVNENNMFECGLTISPFRSGQLPLNPPVIVFFFFFFFSLFFPMFFLGISWPWSWHRGTPKHFPSGHWLLRQCQANCQPHYATSATSTAPWLIGVDASMEGSLQLQPGYLWPFYPRLYWFTWDDSPRTCPQPTRRLVKMGERKDGNAMYMVPAFQGPVLTFGGFLGSQHWMRTDLQGAGCLT